MLGGEQQELEDQLRVLEQSQQEVVVIWTRLVTMEGSGDGSGICYDAWT